jgi:hypothetical protein
MVLSEIFTDLIIPNGISQLARDIRRRRFYHLSWDSVIETYRKNLIDDHPWQFVCGALMIRETNLRRNEINALFGSVSLPDFWHHIEGDPDVKSL